MRHVIGENYLCFYSLMEMILDDIGYGEWNQYSLANIFGVVLPNEYIINGVENVVINDDERMCGIHIDCRAINKFMEKENIPLKVSYIPSNPYGEYNINKSYLMDKYCICTYSYGSLYNEKDKWQVGHASLFMKYLNDNEVEIYDPGPREVGEKKVKLYNLYQAMYDARGGFYLFEKSERDMNRYFLSRKDECRGNCKYCFGKWNNYLKFPSVEAIKDNSIVYPNCDGDAFDGNWDEMIEEIKKISGKNIVISISTKFNISDDILKDLEQVNQLLQTNSGMLKVSVSFSCEKSIEVLEKNTAKYFERINLIKRLTERKIPYFTIIKPILPFIEFNEYKKIIDDTIAFCPYYVIGDLYVDLDSEFYKEYIENMKYSIRQKNVSWNGDNGVWSVVEDDELKNKIESYIIQLGGKVFESDKEAIMYIRK